MSYRLVCWTVVMRFLGGIKYTLQLATGESSPQTSVNRSTLGKLLLCSTLVGVMSCGGNDKNSARQTDVSPPIVATKSVVKDTVESSRGRLHWTLPVLEAALAHAGLKPVRKGTVRQPFMGPEGAVYQIGSSELQAYLYADAVAAGRDADPLDATRVAPPTMQITWRLPPTLVVDNNIVLILLSRDEDLRVQVRSAIRNSHGD